MSSREELLGLVKGVSNFLKPSNYTWQFVWADSNHNKCKNNEATRYCLMGAFQKVSEDMGKPELYLLIVEAGCGSI